MLGIRIAQPRPLAWPPRAIAGLFLRLAQRHTGTRLPPWGRRTIWCNAAWPKREPDLTWSFPAHVHGGLAFVAQLPTGNLQSSGKALICNILPWIKRPGVEGRQTRNNRLVSGQPGGILPTGHTVFWDEILEVCLKLCHLDLLLSGKICVLYLDNFLEGCCSPCYLWCNATNIPIKITWGIISSDQWGAELLRLDHCCITTNANSGLRNNSLEVYASRALLSVC